MASGVTERRSLAGAFDLFVFAYHHARRSATSGPVRTSRRSAGCPERPICVRCADDGRGSDAPRHRLSTGAVKCLDLFGINLWFPSSGQRRWAVGIHAIEAAADEPQPRLELDLHPRAADVCENSRILVSGSV